MNTSIYPKNIFLIKLVSGLGYCISRDIQLSCKHFDLEHLKRKINTHTWMKWDSNLNYFVQGCSCIEHSLGPVGSLWGSSWVLFCTHFLFVAVGSEGVCVRHTKTPSAGICLLCVLGFRRIILHALFAWCIFENLSKEHTLICSAVFCICFYNCK